MNKNQMLIVTGIVVLGLVLAFVYQGMVSTPAPTAPALRPTGMQQASSPFQKTDKDGNTWALVPASGQSFTSLDTGGLQAGPAVVIKTDVRRASDREISIGLVLANPAGGVFQPGVRKNGGRLPAPAFRIVDEAGKVLVQDSFSYG
jgi:hypothetical protein